jgi:hypothetical protein
MAISSLRPEHVKLGCKVLDAYPPEAHYREDEGE